MPIYEIVYETGNHSLAQYDSEEEALQALDAHQERAKAGQSATPESTTRTDTGDLPMATTWPAERIARVYVFDNHPAEYGVGQQVRASDLTATIEGMKDADGLVTAPEAAAAVRESTSPLVTPSEPHGSQYAMESTELAWENN